MIGIFQLLSNVMGPLSYTQSIVHQHVITCNLTHSGVASRMTQAQSPLGGALLRAGRGSRRLCVLRTSVQRPVTGAVSPIARRHRSRNQEVEVERTTRYGP